MDDKVEKGSRQYTSARILVDTAAVLGDQKRRLSIVAGRDLSTDDVIRMMHSVFVQQPADVIEQAVAQ
jgi:hypothetical protein